ncbi:unnamed protein product [Somion occarium]|uniref:LAA1-like C-terminal TPR repeats domain-containing protein n=1 Tax=Somion occarium TaxID=3059160 RepID=A0ABP1CTE4_9APHY
MNTDKLAIEDVIDEAKLKEENGEIYLFQWLASNERAIQHASSDDLKATQEALEGTLLNVLSGSGPYPPPGRPLRNLVARCFVALYSRGNTKSLFETLQALFKTAGEQKIATQDISRVAAVYCVGELMRVFGTQVMSQVANSVTLCLKLQKQSTSPIILKYHALLTLEKTISSGRRALSDNTLKDILKQMKNALGDKALPIVRAASKVLITMYPAEDGTRAPSEVESIVSLCVKHLDGADQPTRSAVAQLAGHMLASTQVERVLPPSDPSKRSKKSGDEQDEEEKPTPVALGIATEVKLIMTPNEMLSQLSNHFNKPQTSHKTRLGLISCYIAVLSILGPSFVERNYTLIVGHFMSEIVSHASNTGSRHGILFVRSLVKLVFRDLIGVRMLNEQAQILAIQELSTAYLKRWPAMLPGQTAPGPLVLAIALQEVAGLVQQLGNAPPPVQDALLDPVISLLTHPNHTVRVFASWTLQSFCYSTPLRLPKTLLNLVEMLQHDISQLNSPVAPADIQARALGHAYGLSALLALVPHRPLYVSYDINANVFYMAVQLLKGAGEHDVHIAGVEVEIAWTLIAALMSLGPHFVRAHLPQLLVLWRNALPKPTTKDGSTKRSASEWMFLLQVRENALRAVHHFLKCNASSLVTADVARRISSLLGNALQFANTFSTQRIEEPTDRVQETEEKGLTLRGAEALLRSRVFQCFSLLDLSAVSDATQSLALQSTIALFASPEGYSGSTVQAAIASSSGNFVHVWQTFDGYAYGVSDIDIASDISVDGSDGGKDWLNRDPIDASIDGLVHTPIIRSMEHDPLVLCHKDVHISRQPTSPAALTAAVNSGILLFAQLLPLQDPPSTARMVTKLIESVNSSRSEKNPGRKFAVLFNATVALLIAFKQTSGASKRLSDALSNPQVTSTLASFLKDVLIDGDIFLRQAASEAIGRLCSLAGTTFLSTQIKTLVNEVVANRDPHGRAGCALAFGAIYGNVGGLAAGPLLKTTVHVLMSLINDPHPVVHFWALRALSRVIDSANLTYAAYVPSTLGLLFRTYMLESHEPEGGSVNYVNLSGDLPIYQAICQNIDAIVTVVGPDIQDSVRTRTLVLDLVELLGQEDNDGACVEAMKCIQHFLMFAPEYVDVPKLVHQFRGYLSSSRRLLKEASINALYQLVQKDAVLMSRLGGDLLVEELFAMLDDDSSVDGVRSVITVWLQQTVVHNPSAWIDICQRIMSRTTASQQVAEATAKRVELGDDEGQSFSTGSGEATSGQSRPVARWRTQLFALQCLHTICTVVRQSGRREHVDVIYARSQSLPISGLLVSRIADLVRIAFTASAAHVMEIRLDGLLVLRDVVEIFASVPDPEFENSSILEQYQAPITAALTPAFSSDSTPEILASAIKVCAVFLGSGAVQDIERLGRIRKILTSALEQCKEPTFLQLGDAADLGPNASVMLRISTLAAWAELKIASRTHAYLSEVLQVHASTLAPLWISCLRDYASIKVGVEGLDDVTAASLDTSYGGLGREVLLPYYADSWATILHAIVISMKAQDSYIQAAMNGQIISQTAGDSGEPAAFFFTLFGLAFEVLTTSTYGSSNSASQVMLIAIQTVECLVHKQFSGRVFADVRFLEELIRVLYRLALAEHEPVLHYLLDAIVSLAEVLTSSSPGSIDHCLKISLYIMKRCIDESERFPSSLFNQATEALSKILIRMDKSVHADTLTVSLSVYSGLLQSEIIASDAVIGTLQSLRLLLKTLEETNISTSQLEQMLHGILSQCLLNIDSMRGRKGPACDIKIKNNMFAIVLILTTYPSKIKLGQLVIDHTCQVIIQLLLDLEETAVTAAHCARTLILASLSGNPHLSCCGKLLLPGLTQSLIKLSANSDALSSQLVSVVYEAWRCFVALVNASSEHFRIQALAFTLPSMILFLHPSIRSLDSLHQQTLTHILSFASSYPANFKEVTSKLEQDMRECLEISVKEVLGGSSLTVADLVKPQISLRVFQHI